MQTDAPEAPAADSAGKKNPNPSKATPIGRDISDAKLRALKPAEKAYRQAVGGGLYLEVMPSGSKLWRWKYRLDGRENRFAIGKYPRISLVQAREAAEQARKLVREGRPPSLQKRMDSLQAAHGRHQTLEDVANEWLGLKTWEDITKKRRLNMLERVVFPQLGSLPIRQITPPIILDVLKTAAQKNGITVMAEAKRTLFGIEAGAGDYQMPWNTAGSSASLPQNPVGKYQYHGINVLSLWASQQLRTFTSGQWATYRQWRSIGAQVRKGEMGSATVFYQPIIPGDQSNSADDSEESAGRRGSRPFILKMATVFNADQVDGFNPENVTLPAAQRHELAERVIKESGARILWGGDKACYLPTRDEIHLPSPEAFVSTDAYYGVAFHELIHWTGHNSRCERDLSGRFGTSAYAMEELVAELGAAFLSAEVGLSQQPRKDHAQYISSWLDVLRTEPKAIFSAAREANAACRYLCLATAAHLSTTSD